MAFQADCPTCGAPIEFSIATSVVTICESCGTASGRKGDALENYGKVAELVDTASPLQIDVVGETGGIPFKITGRTQLRHSAGGVWDEWYVTFRDGKQWGWLAEARGRYYLTFPKKLPEGHHIPEISELNVEDEVMIPKKGVMKVVEIGQATAISAEGEIPYEFHPGETYWYADLEGAAGKFATLDGSTSPPTVYVGGEFSLEKLGITADVADRELDEKRAEAAHLACPHCGGTIDLVAPDEAQRVGCPYCNSLLDVNEGNLKFLHTLSIKRKPTIPLGTRGTLEGTEYTVIGFMERYVTVEGVDYAWGEYLLYAPRKPFHWLIEANHHWTFGKPVSAGEVRASYRSARYAGRTYKLFDRGVPVVKTVVGEFYWKVAAGERTASSDYVSPPYILSREESLESRRAEAKGLPAVGGKRMKAEAKEVNYTVGHYVPVADVEQAFGVKGLKRPTSVAPNQPFPHKNMYLAWVLMLAAAIVIGLFVYVSADRRQVFQQSYSLSREGLTGPSGVPSPAQIEMPAEPIAIRGGDNLMVEFSNSLANRWAYLELDLVDQNNQKTVVTVPIQYEQTMGTKYVAALPQGSYALRLAFKWQNMASGETQNVSVRILEDVPRMRYWVALIVLLSILPIGVAISHGMFESQRWAESGVS